MRKMRLRGQRVLLTVLLLVTLFSSVFQFQPASAAQITLRKLTLGSSLTNANTTYTFDFTVPNTVTVLQSASFVACTTASGTCTTPPGWDGSPSGTPATASQPTNLGDATGWSTADSTATELRISKTGNVAAPTGAQTVAFSGVVNPTAINTTFFLRITTFSDDAWTTPVDSGTVAASTARAIVVTGTMPESLVFCTAETITVIGVVPDCSSASDGSVSFNQLFSPSATATATSQMAASTNAGSGYVITVGGSTLTSGSNTITAMSAATTSAVGVSQFGLNLVVNTVPAVGTAIAPVSNAANYRANPATGYEVANTFKFVPAGDTIARSDDGSPGSPAPTDSQLYTASYIVNVPGSQPAGDYVSTLVYVCTATF